MPVLDTKTSREALEPLIEGEAGKELREFIEVLMSNSDAATTKKYQLVQHTSDGSRTVLDNDVAGMTAERAIEFNRAQVTGLLRLWAHATSCSCCGPRSVPDSWMAL